MEQSIFTRVSHRFFELYRHKVVQENRTFDGLKKVELLLQSNEFARQLYGLYQSLCFKYEDSSLYGKVLDALDLELIYSNVEAMPGTDDDYQDRLVKELLRYFKHNFFTWCDKPICINCKTSETQVFQCNVTSNDDEAKYECRSVELYYCTECKSLTRFPRYNDPIKLLETKKGRCGEWCNLFTLILKSFGIETRYVWNREDHVWCEFYSYNLKRWVHVDSCEESFDEPGIYSVNWNKKMSYIIAFSSDSAVDVSKRYIIKNKLPRDQIYEKDLKIFLSFITKNLRKSINDDELYKLSCRDEQEQLTFLHGDLVKVSTENSYNPGRKSGSTDWKKMRGEDGCT